MWIGHYLVGLSFYTFTNIAMVAENSRGAGLLSSDVTDRNLFLSTVCITGFFMAQIVQHMVHKRLAEYRALCRPGQYLNPNDGFFRYLIAPHYTAEIFLYLSLAVLNRTNLCLYWVVLWTVLTLGTSALETNAWGMKTFADWGNRWVILPGVL